MGMTMTQKVLAAHCGAEKVEAGKVYTVALNEKGNLSGRNSIFSHPIE